MDDHDTLIVSRLKDPWKFLFIDMDIAMLAATVGFALMLMGMGTIVMVGGALTVGYYLHKQRQGRPRGFARHLCYWYLPPALSFLKRTPAPFCQRTVG